LLSLRLGTSDVHCGGGSPVVRHVVAYDRDGAPSAYGWRRESEIGVDVPEVATFYLPAGGASLTAIPEEPVVPGAVLDAYYGTALPLIVQATQDVEVLHGSAVLVPSRRGVVAFSGISESGKSTLAYGLAARGYGHWADDAVAVRMDGSRSVTAVGLPFAVELGECSSAQLGASSDALGVVEEFAWREARFGALFLLDGVDRKDSAVGAVAVERLAPAQALRALLPNAFRFQPQAPERRRATMRSYLELVASVPVLSARFAHDLDQLPELLDELERWIHEVA
jgi:hypothetical protein